MKKELFDYIQKLSLDDNKGLLGKALKTQEEVGELAKVILPYENSPGTLHRFTTRENVLDGVADVILSAISIAYHLGYNHDEIESMLLKKSKKWGNIIAKEGVVNFPIWFEIHITVKILFDTGMVETFKNVCEMIGVKPIIIELEKNEEVVMEDVMTSSKHLGTNRSAYDEAMRIDDCLRSNGFEVSRVKIETVPWHPMAPKIINDAMPQDCYFESHLRIVTNVNRKPTLEKIANYFGAHLSRNFFKKISNDEYIIMMTLRDDDTWFDKFNERVESLKTHLTNNDFEVDKKEIEFAVYDSKINHDAVWLKQ